MTFGCALRAPSGGIGVFPVVYYAVIYCVALAVGSVVGAVIAAACSRRPAPKNNKAILLLFKYKQPRRPPSGRYRMGAFGVEQIVKKALPSAELARERLRGQMTNKHKNPPGSGFLCIEGWEKI